mgnify:CR=1 FL=1
MLNDQQLYILEIAENLLIELAYDRVYKTELNEKTANIIQLLPSKEEKEYLLEKLKIREQPTNHFSVIIQQITEKMQ